MYRYSPHGDIWNLVWINHGEIIQPVKSVGVDPGSLPHPLRISGLVPSRTLRTPGGSRNFRFRSRTMQDRDFRAKPSNLARIPLIFYGGYAPVLFFSTVHLTCTLSIHTRSTAGPANPGLRERNREIRNFPRVWYHKSRSRTDPYKSGIKSAIDGNIDGPSYSTKGWPL